MEVCRGTLLGPYMRKEKNREYRERREGFVNIFIYHESSPISVESPQVAGRDREERGRQRRSAAPSISVSFVGGQGRDRFWIWRRGWVALGKLRGPSDKTDAVASLLGIRYMTSKLDEVHEKICESQNMIKTISEIATHPRPAVHEEPKGGGAGRKSIKGPILLPRNNETRDRDSMME